MPKKLHTITFHHEKDTKNTRVFEEVTPEDQYPVVGKMYLAKPAMAQLGNPDDIVVTVEAAP